MFFPVVTYECESWTVKKSKRQRIDTFELWCWRRFPRVSWTTRRSNQSILKEINPEYSLEGLMLKLKPQFFGHLLQRTNSLEKTLMLEKIEGRRRRGQQRTKWLDGITNSMNVSLSKLREVKDRSLTCYSSWGCTESDTTERLNNNIKCNYLINISAVSQKNITCVDNKIKIRGKWSAFKELAAYGLLTSQSYQRQILVNTMRVTKSSTLSFFPPS